MRGQPDFVVDAPGLELKTCPAPDFRQEEPKGDVIDDVGFDLYQLRLFLVDPGLEADLGQNLCLLTLRLEALARLRPYDPCVATVETVRRLHRKVVGFANLIQELAFL